jgi:hypothetical protein
LAAVCLNLLPHREGTICIRRPAGEIAEPGAFGKLLEKIVDERPEIAAARARLDRLQPFVIGGACVCQRLFKRR